MDPQRLWCSWFMTLSPHTKPLKAAPQAHKLAASPATVGCL